MRSASHPVENVRPYEAGVRRGTLEVGEIVALAIGWILTGLVIVVTGLLAGRSRRALTGRAGSHGLRDGWTRRRGQCGPGGHRIRLHDLRRTASYSATVRDTLGVAGSPQVSVFVALLIAYQAAAGLVILFGGRWVEVGLGAGIALQVGLLAFGWWYFLVSPLVILGLALLWRAWRRAENRTLYVPDILEAREHDRRSLTDRVSWRSTTRRPPARSGCPDRHRRRARPGPPGRRGCGTPPPPPPRSGTGPVRCAS